jgi:hypothetical protein
LGVTVLVTALLVAVPAGPVSAGGAFTDDDGNTHERAIEAIVAEGITLGCGDFAYCPSEPVSRGQMASFLARAFQLPATETDYFDDDGGTHEDNINRIAAAGMTSGFSDGTFKPDGAVSREQLASFLARALGLSPVEGSEFADVSGVHAGNIYAVAGAGITVGCNTVGTEFCPADDVRRDQMASFLARALDLPVQPVPDALYDVAWEQCVWEGIEQASRDVGEETTLLYGPQTAIARENATEMQALGSDWNEHVLAPEFLTDDMLSDLGLTGASVFISEQVVQGLNLACESMVEGTAPDGEWEDPTHRYVGIGAVVDPITGWVYQSVIQIRVSEL